MLNRPSLHPGSVHAGPGRRTDEVDDVVVDPHVTIPVAELQWRFSRLVRRRRSARQHHGLPRRAVVGPPRLAGADGGAAGTGPPAARCSPDRRRRDRHGLRAPLAAAQPRAGRRAARPPGRRSDRALSPPRRRPTGPTAGSRRRRADDKRRRAETKRLRRPPTDGLMASACSEDSARSAAPGKAGLAGHARCDTNAGNPVPPARTYSVWLRGRSRGLADDGRPDRLGRWRR